MSLKIRTLALTLVLAAALSLTGTPAKRAPRGELAGHAPLAAAWSESAIEDEYARGASFTLPARTVTAGGKTAAALTVLEYPDGRATRSAEVTLDMSGVYTLTYTAEIEGKPYLDRQTFRVKDPVANVTAAESAVAYGHYTTTREGKTHDNKPGLMVRLADGDTLTFSEVIDVSGLTRDDVLVEAFVTPDVIGQADFRRLYFTFTDAENPGVYMRISARQSAEGDNYPATYYLAGGNGQPLVGWEESWERLHIDNEWGAQAAHSFSLRFGGNNTAWREPETMPISLRFDAAGLAVYTGGTMIIDFDNPAYFNTLWKGFPSGKARLSVSAAMYNSATANFCVTKVRGIDLTQTTFEDKEPPEITIDTDYPAMPPAEKGGFYPVPEAAAHDVYSGDCEVRVSAWYNYASDNAVLVDIKDGKFATERTGDYAIVYEAEDRNRNVGRALLWVRAAESVPEPTVTLLSDPVTSASVGSLLTLPAYQTSGGSGRSSVSVTATRGGETTAVTGGAFRPEKAGTYTIAYTATDHIGRTGTISFELTAVMGDAPVFGETPVLPGVLVSGSPYALPLFYATDYRSGQPVKKAASAEIEDASGKRTVGAGETFTPTVTENGDRVKITYKCEGAVYPTVSVPCIVAWIEDPVSGRPRLQLENYLYAPDGGFTVTKAVDSVTVTAAKPDAGWTFANAMLAYDFDLKLKGVAGKAAFDRLNIVLTDAADPTCRVTAALVNGAETRFETAGASVGLSDSLSDGDTFEIGYKNGHMTVNGIRVATVTTKDDGSPFTGFASGKLYAGVYFSGAQTGAAYELLTFNGHTTNNGTTDRGSPKIVVYGDHGGSYKPGDLVTLPAAAACDVLDPNVTLSMTASDGQGNPLTDVDGTTLVNVDPGREYTVKISTYGQYSVKITAADTFNERPNKKDYPYAINVDDDAPPEITFQGEFQTTAKQGETLVIPDFTVKDNISAAQAIVVTKYALTPSGVLVPLPGKSNSIKAVSTGVYEFRILAVDEAGNVCMIRKPVAVTAA